MDPDKLFQHAWELSAKGKRDQARYVCRLILKQKPAYSDVRIFLGRLHSWDREYDDARREFLQVLAAKPDSRDARSALIDVEYWSKNLDSALRHCNIGLEFYPNDHDFLYKKARILYRQADYRPAASSVRRLLQLDPSHQEGLLLLERIRYSSEIFSVAQKYRFDGDKKAGADLNPWHLFSLELKTQTKIGSLIGRVNYARRRYGSSWKAGEQFEIDAYPRFMDGLYAYLNAGYSNDSIFPKYRLGAELFANLPAGLEVSLGIRYLEFSSTIVRIFTGSLGKYYKNYWFSLRPFITNKPSGISASVILSARRYYGSRDDYLGLFSGYGSTPLEVYYLEDVERLNSLKVGLELKRALSRIFVIQCRLRFEREEYALDKFGNRFTFAVNLEERIFRRY